jgi:phosphoribosyl-AMP cyclohydrolase
MRDASLGVVDPCQGRMCDGLCEMHLEELPAAVVDRVVVRLRDAEPDAIGVLVHGSYARGDARRESDLDLTVLVSKPGPVHYRCWFEELSDGSLLYVSADCDLTVNRWHEQQEEAEDWSFGFPVAIAFRWIWALDDDVRVLLGEAPIERHPAGAVAVEDVVETTTKVIRAAADGDVDAVRFWAHAMIQFLAPTFVAVNEPVEVGDPLEALRRLLELPIVPPDWRDGTRVCLGLDLRDASQVATTARRLAVNTLTFLGERFPLVDPQPWVSEALVDGTYLRWLSSMPGSQHGFGP